MPENSVDTEVIRMSVTDGDEPNSPAWNAKFTIVSGDPDGLFKVKTGTNKHEGIISTAKVGSQPGISRMYHMCRIYNYIVPFTHVMQVKRTFLTDQLYDLRFFFFLLCNQGLDFEKRGKHTLLVAVENEVPFATSLPTATATVVVAVQDVNEAPIFDPKKKVISKSEDLPVGSDLVQYTASDPDTARNQKVM